MQIMDDTADVKVAPISFGIALIPSDPIYSEVSQASLAITKLCENRNIIDNKRFPCHLSMILAGTSEPGLEFLREDLLRSVPLRKLNAEATRVYTGSNGFIGVSIRGSDCQEFHDSLMRSMKRLMAHETLIRPHLKERWPRLSPSERASLVEYGSYHVGNGFQPHLSVAQVDSDELADMTKVAKKTIRVPQSVSFAELQVIDVGHKNEKWEVRHSIPLA